MLSSPRSSRLRESVRKGNHKWGRRAAIAVIGLAVWIVAVPAAAEGRAAPHLSEGYALLRAGDVRGAERSYLTAVRAQPDYAPAWLVLGDFYHGVRNDCGEAVPWYEGFLARAGGVAAPMDVVLEKVIACHEAAENWDAAAARCSELVAWNRERRRHEDAISALRRRSENEIRAGRYEQSLTTLQALLFRDGNDRRAWELRAFARFQLGQFEAALEDHYWIRSAFGPDRYVNREIGAALFKLGRLQPARESLLLSLRIDGEHADTLRWLARTWEELGRPAEAEKAWRQCLHASPGARLAAVAANNLAWLLARRCAPGDPRLLEAHKLASDAVDADGDEPRFLDTLAEVSLRLGRGTDALRYARRAFREAPSDPYYRDRFVALRDAAHSHATPGGLRRFERSPGLKSSDGPSRTPD